MVTHIGERNIVKEDLTSRYQRRQVHSPPYLWNRYMRNANLLVVGKLW